MAETKTVGKVLTGVTCYTDNVSELIKQFVADYTDPVTGKFKEGLGFNDVVTGVNALVAKIKESALECEGVEISIPAPEGTVGAVLTVVLAAIGLDLFD